jgi:hypothetical protein
VLDAPPQCRSKDRDGRKLASAILRERWDCAHAHAVSKFGSQAVLLLGWGDFRAEDGWAEVSPWLETAAGARRFIAMLSFLPAG